MTRFLFILVASTVLVVGCGRPELPTEAKTASSALNKLSAATEVGVSFPEYGRLLIEAKAAVNAAEGKLPVVLDSRVLNDELVTDPELRLQLTHYRMLKAIDAYTEAHRAWQRKIAGTTILGSPEGRALLEKYKLKSVVSEDALIQELWAIARIHTMLLPD